MSLIWSWVLVFLEKWAEELLCKIFMYEEPEKQELPGERLQRKAQNKKRVTTFSKKQTKSDYNVKIYLVS